MKKTLLVLLVIPLIFFESCNDEFSINAPYEDVYVLKCILHNDSPVQYAILSKNCYTENGAPPDSTNIIQYVKNASIKIFCNDSVFVMRDTTIQLTVYGAESQVSCYYLKNLVITPGKVVSIEASVPDGTVLRSTIQIQGDIYLSGSAYLFPRSYYSGYLPIQGYRWRLKVYNNVGNTKIYNLPQLEVYFKKYEGGTFVEKKILVPLVDIYNLNDENTILHNTILLSFNRSCFTTLKTINKTMQDISGNDPYKNNYVITKAVFSILVLDSFTEQYCFAYKTEEEAFSIGLRPTNMSNIEGGKGHFGACFKVSQSIKFDSLYVKSFGYRYAPF